MIFPEKKAGPGLVHKVSDLHGSAGSSSLVDGCVHMAGNAKAPALPSTQGQHNLENCCSKQPGSVNSARSGLKCQCHHLLAMCTSVSCPSSLNLQILCKLEIIIAPTSQDCCHV